MTGTTPIFIHTVRASILTSSVVADIYSDSPVLVSMASAFRMLTSQSDYHPGCLMDKALGMYHYETIYDDSNPDQIETLPPSAIHRIVDLELVNADKQGMYALEIISVDCSFPSYNRLCQDLHRSTWMYIRFGHREAG